MTWAWLCLLLGLIAILMGCLMATLSTALSPRPTIFDNPTALSRTFAYLQCDLAQCTQEEFNNMETLIQHGLLKYTVNAYTLVGTSFMPTNNVLVNTLLAKYGAMQLVASLNGITADMAVDKLISPTSRLTVADKVLLTQLVQIAKKPESRVCSYYIADEPMAFVIGASVFQYNLNNGVPVFATVQTGTIVTPVSNMANQCWWNESTDATCPCANTLFQIQPQADRAYVKIYAPGSEDFYLFWDSDVTQSLGFTYGEDPLSLWAITYDLEQNVVTVGQPAVTSLTFPLLRYGYTAELLQDVYETIRAADPDSGDRPVVLADTAYFFTQGRSLQCVPEVPTGSFDILLMDQYATVDQQPAWMNFWAEAGLWLTTARPWGFVFLTTNSTSFPSSQLQTLFNYVQNFTLSGSPLASQTHSAMSALYAVQNTAGATRESDTPATLTGTNFTNMLAFVDYLHQQLVDV